MNKEQKNHSTNIQRISIPNHTSQYLSNTKLCIDKCTKNKDPTKGEVTVLNISQNNAEQTKTVGLKASHTHPGEKHLLLGASEEI